MLKGRPQGGFQGGAQKGFKGCFKGVLNRGLKGGFKGGLKGGLKGVGPPSRTAKKRDVLQLSGFAFQFMSFAKISKIDYLKRFNARRIRTTYEYASVYECSHV